MSNIEKVNQFLTEAGYYFLATVDGDSPKVRPIGLNILDDEKIYFGVGTFKEVYKQMIENPKVEICAFSKGKTLRYSGTAVFTSDCAMEEKALDLIPRLKDIYNETTGNKMGMFYLENAKADIYEGLDVTESYKF